MNSRGLIKLAISLGCGLLLWMGMLLPVHSQTQTETERAGLVVEFLDGRMITRCVQINKTPFTGYDLLQQSGLTFITDFNASVGAAICKIQEEGCPGSQCFCAMPNYWNYWHLKTRDGSPTWEYSPLGASNYTVQAGEVEGWRFGPGQPPAHKPAFNEICPESAPLPTAAASATPIVNEVPPTRPPAWVTAVIVGGYSPTPPASPTPAPTTTPLAAPPSPPTPPSAGFSATPPVLEVMNAALTEAAEPAALLPAEPPSQPTSTQANQIIHQATVTSQPPPASEKSRAEPVVQVISTQAVVAQSVLVEPAAAPRLSTWALILGGLAGLGSFIGFFMALVGGLILVYLIRRR